MDWWEDYPVIPNLTVYEPDREPTGLLDSQGRPIMKPANRMGFDLWSHTQTTSKRTNKRLSGRGETARVVPAFKDSAAR